jgi:hypothetical protein
MKNKGIIRKLVIAAIAAVGIGILTIPSDKAKKFERTITWQ